MFELGRGVIWLVDAYMFEFGRGVIWLVDAYMFGLGRGVIWLVDVYRFGWAAVLSGWLMYTGLVGQGCYLVG